MVEDGYEFFAKRHLVTLFSAPNYCGEFDNAGAMMSVDETLLCSFQVCISFPYNAARFPSLHLHYNHLTSQVNHNHICTLTFFCYRFGFLFPYLGTYSLWSCCRSLSPPIKKPSTLTAAARGDRSHRLVNRRRRMLTRWDRWIVTGLSGDRRAEVCVRRL